MVINERCSIIPTSWRHTIEIIYVQTMLSIPGNRMDRRNEEPEAAVSKLLGVSLSARHSTGTPRSPLQNCQDSTS